MKLSWRDKFQMTTTVLFVVVGVTMLVRSTLLARHASSAMPPPLLAYLLGAAFVGYGVYRTCLIVRALRGRRPPL